jgi:hypothetical protein
MTRLSAGLNKVLLLLLTLALLSCAASAAGTGTLHVINATGVAKDDTATVSVVLTNDYNPKMGSLGLKIYYDSAVATAVSADSPVGFTLPVDLSSPITVGGATVTGVPNGDPIIVNITFQSMKNDGSATDIGLYVQSARDIAIPPGLLTVSVQNGTFTTKDEVAPVITLNTPRTVSSTFNIAGTITDVGGMGTAQATLKNATHAAVPYVLPLSGPAPGYTFDRQVTWPIEDSVILTVTATDAAGNTATTTQVIDVVNVGFSQPAPTGYINATPPYAQAFMSQMNKPTVGMILGSATYGPIPLALDTSTNYAVGTMPGVLPDDEYWVNVSGTDVFGDERYLNWTFTLDTTAPVINTFTITDSDGDGYIEAGENLHLAWNVAADASFDHVALVDTATGQEVWSSSSISGTATPLIDDGNRDLEFRAYDKAYNYDSRAFHLYYDYMIWVNSTKVGVVSGIDTTYTAAKDLSRTAVSSITLYNARDVPLPSLDKLERTVTNLGQVASDTYVTADNTANRTLLGSETYQNAWVYNPDKTFDFSVKVAHAPRAVLVLAEANESYIADLISGGSGGMHSVNYTELIQKTAYIFIDGGWAKVKVADDGTISMPDQSGNAIATGSGSIADTLRHPANQVNLNTGYRLSAQNLKPITLPPGDYALAAIAMDGDRLGLLAAMPVIVLESDDPGSIFPESVKPNENFTAGFTTPCERLGVVLLRDVTYEGTAFIDAANLGKDTLKLNITHDNIPATQNLIGNVYVSPNSGKYVVKENTNQATVSTEGLDTGTYLVYLAGQSANGTVQAYGMYTLEITPEVPPTPQPTTPPSGGGGGGRGGFAPETGSSSLLIGSDGKLLRPYTIRSPSGIAELYLPLGTYAVDADGNPLSEVSIDDLDPADLPAVPAGAAYTFAGHAVVCSPSGARFDPAISLIFTFNADQWSEIMQAAEYDASSLVVKWYDEEAGEWETVPTVVDPATRTVTASVEHFTVFGLFVEPGAVTPVVTPTTPIVTPTTPTTTTPVTPPAEGFPWTYVVIAVVIILVIAVGVYYYTRKP